MDLNKRGIIKVILAILVIGSITGIYLYNKNKIYNITIIAKFWNQYGEQYLNKESKFNIKLNDEIKLNNGSNDVTFKVIEVKKDYITIKTSEKMSQIKNDLLLVEDEFVVKINEEIKLNRMITGTGVSYTIKLEQ